MLNYNLVGDSNGQSMTLVFSDGSINVVPSSHPSFVRALGYLVDTPFDEVDEAWVRRTLDIIETASLRLTALSERVALQGRTILFDGDVLNNSLTNHILRLIAEDDEGGWKGLVNFLEKLATNPEPVSRDSLYSWISDRDLTITEDGDFIAYKGVKVVDGESFSISQGTAFVDGEKFEGAIPNPSGAVVSMPRASVEMDTAVGCSTGLHAGTWEYASSFSRERVLKVRINPRDVVSVPKDCNAQKLRVSRYTVIDEVEMPLAQATYYASNVEPEDDDYDYDYDEDEIYDNCLCGDPECDGYGY